MRRLLAVVLIALGLPLVAASPNVFYSKPSVVVYPFTTNGASSIDREASSRLATILATQMANSGKVTVIPPPPGTERKDYLTAARAHNADYYVSGYLSPLGSGVSMVEQVVSTSTGIVVFSQSAQLTTYNDAAGQGDDLATFISNHANRGLALIPTPAPQTSPTPVPSTGPEANLNKIFSRRKKTAATPAPKPAATPAAALSNVAAATPRATSVPAPPPPPVAAATAAPAAPAAAHAVLPVEGDADATLREWAAQRLAFRVGADRAASAKAACTGRTPRDVLAGTLTTKPAQDGGGAATFALTATDCAGKVLAKETFTETASGAKGLQTAMERAVDAASAAYLHPRHRRR